ncbi:MAG TPA: abortive infection family protein [Lachnospiraceae bacterium]|nr:abortive infection family protein [Lachnospiraceae bacterium]
MYESACSINRLRNKQGTGHGHPFVTTLSKEEGKVVISIMGAIAEYMLAKL